MPNRIIKESICTSETIDQLTPFQETVFIRLIVNADDYGRFYGNPKIVSARLFPLKSITPEEMTEALKALTDAELITPYVSCGKTYLLVNSWAKHQQTRATKSKFPEPSAIVPDSSDSNGNQVISDDIKCARYSYSYSINDNRNSLSLSGEEAADIAADHDRILNAAETAGFARNDATRAKLIDLYATHGLQKVLDGIGSCVDHGVSNIAYLTAVLKGEPKRQKPTVNAQNYEQRDYSGSDSLTDVISVLQGDMRA